MTWYSGMWDFNFLFISFGEGYCQNCIYLVRLPFKSFTSWMCILKFMIIFVFFSQFSILHGIQFGIFKVWIHSINPQKTLDHYFIVHVDFKYFYVIVKTFTPTSTIINNIFYYKFFTSLNKKPRHKSLEVCRPLFCCS